eukprot:351665-Chlamydomonas_euryale.AAC.6
MSIRHRNKWIWSSRALADVSLSVTKEGAKCQTNNHTTYRLKSDRATPHCWASWMKADCMTAHGPSILSDS